MTATAAHPPAPGLSQPGHHDPLKCTRKRCQYCLHAGKSLWFRVCCECKMETTHDEKEPERYVLCVHCGKGLCLACGYVWVRVWERDGPKRERQVAMAEMGWGL